MIRILIVALVLFLLAAYLYLQSGVWRRKVADYKGYSVVCVDGVKYVQFSTGASVKYAKTGLPELCD